jgi:hypothetical protein
LQTVGSRFASARALRLHLTALVVVASCLMLGWWQLERALSGNTLSWVYTFEWPFFAGYAIFMWWRLLHEAPEGTRGSVATHGRADALGRAGPRDAERDAADELRLAEYNRYLADLQEIDRSRRN